MSKSKFSSGFTLIELVVAVTIAAIVLVIAVPNMSPLMQSSQATQQSHDFISAVQLAASEAENNNAKVSICAKQAGSNACVAYTTNPATTIWPNGWLMFIDTGDNGIYDGADTLLKVQANSSNALLITAPASTVTINPANIVTRGSGTWDFKPKNCSYNGGHRVVLNANSRVTVAGISCP